MPINVRTYALRIIGLVVVNLLLSACSDILSGHITHDEKLQSKPIALGQFLVRYQTTDSSLPALKVTHNRSENKVLWQTVPGKSFVMGGKGKENVHEVKGSFFIDDETQDTCEDQTVTSLKVIDDRLVISGDLACR